jgi:DNA-binding MarR family transcriptional regulator
MIAAKPAIGKCAAGTLRRAARSIARVYDARLGAVGLTTSQFSILRNLGTRREPATLAGLAEELVFERTSLHRALEPLRRDGLIAYGAGPGRAKLVSLTPRGARRVAQATPHWTAAQEEFVSRVGRAAWNRLAGELGDIVAIARDMPLVEE